MRNKKKLYFAKQKKKLYSAKHKKGVFCETVLFSFRFTTYSEPFELKTMTQKSRYCKLHHVSWPLGLQKEEIWVIKVDTRRISLGGQHIEIYERLNICIQGI